MKHWRRKHRICSLTNISDLALGNVQHAFMHGAATTPFSASAILKIGVRTPYPFTLLRGQNKRKE